MKLLNKQTSISLHAEQRRDTVLPSAGAGSYGTEARKGERGGSNRKSQWGGDGGVIT